MTIKAYVGPPKLYNTKAFTFEGISNISFVCLNSTEKIVLHIKDISIKQTKVHSIDSNVNLNVSTKLDFDEEKDFLIVNLYNKCEKNKNYKLELEYEGIIASTLYGFYRSSYTDSLGVVHYLATTKFEPTHARRAFPCFDEPAMKAEYAINIIRPKHLSSSFSNMPLIKTEPYSEYIYTCIFVRLFVLSRSFK